MQISTLAVQTFFSIHTQNGFFISRFILLFLSILFVPKYRCFFFSSAHFIFFCCLHSNRIASREPWALHTYNVTVTDLFHSFILWLNCSDKAKVLGPMLLVLMVKRVSRAYWQQLMKISFATITTVFLACVSRRAQNMWKPLTNWCRSNVGTKYGKACNLFRFCQCWRWPFRERTNGRWSQCVNCFNRTNQMNHWRSMSIDFNLTQIRILANN